MSESWRTRAECRGVPVSVFFNDGPPSGTAVILCGRCDVRAHCLAYALADPRLVGYWAGTTEAERARMRKGKVA